MTLGMLVNDSIVETSMLETTYEDTRDRFDTRKPNCFMPKSFSGPATKKKKKYPGFGEEYNPVKNFI